MSTLLLRMVGPLQSWGTTSRFDQRDTGKEPSKSGVIGLIAAAKGIHRENWADIEPLTRLVMGVRNDRPGVPKRDYQTAGCAAEDTIIKADRTQAKNGGIVSHRDYLADAAFLVGLESTDQLLLASVDNALRNPVWPLALGRKSYVPSEPVWMDGALCDVPLLQALRTWPWLGRRRWNEDLPERLLVSYESSDQIGVLKMDQPVASFAERIFRARYVRSEWVPFPKEATDVSE